MPHGMDVPRDNHDDHEVEGKVNDIGKKLLAHGHGCGMIQWSEHARQETKTYKASHGRANPKFRDPNYLTETELKHNGWYWALKQMKDVMRDSQRGPHRAPRKPVMNVDLHGCNDNHIIKPTSKTQAFLGMFPLNAGPNKNTAAHDLVV